MHMTFDVFLSSTLIKILFLSVVWLRLAHQDERLDDNEGAIVMNETPGAVSASQSRCGRSSSQKKTGSGAMPPPASTTEAVDTGGEEDRPPRSA
jgi:hypothetical protein